MSSVSKRIERLELDAMAGRPQQIAIIRRIVSPGDRDDWSTALVRSPAFYGKLERHADETVSEFKARIDGITAKETSI